MKILEIRRRSMRNVPAPHLNQMGVTRARRVGETLGPFDRVVAATLPRAFETAVAMGFAVDEQNDLMSFFQRRSLARTEIIKNRIAKLFNQQIRRQNYANQFSRS